MKSKDDMTHIKDFYFYFKSYETPLHAFEPEHFSGCGGKSRLRITEVGRQMSVGGHC